MALLRTVHWRVVVTAGQILIGMPSSIMSPWPGPSPALLTWPRLQQGVKLVPAEIFVIIYDNRERLYKLICYIFFNSKNNFFIKCKIKKTFKYWFIYFQKHAVLNYYLTYLFNLKIKSLYCNMFFWPPT